MNSHVNIGVSVVNNTGYNLLHMATYHAYGAERLNAVLKRGEANPNFDTNARVPMSGLTALHMAAYNECADKVRCLLEAAHIDANLRDHDGNTALHVAACNAYNKTAAVLVKNRKVDVNALNNAMETPIHCAIKYGGFKTVKVMLRSKRVDLTSKNSDGKSALYLAACTSRSKFFYSLRSEDFNTRNKRGDLPLHIVANAKGCYYCPAECIEKMCERTANINARTSDGRTALHCAAESASFHMISALLKFDRSNTRGKRVNVNARKAGSGDTAFHILMREGQHAIDAVEELLRHPRIGTSLRNRKGLTARDTCDCDALEQLFLKFK